MMFPLNMFTRTLASALWERLISTPCLRIRAVLNARLWGRKVSRLSQSFEPGCWGATKQLWNAFHNCFVAPQHPTSLLQPDPCPGAPTFGAASLFPSDCDSGSPPQMSHSIVVAIQRPGATWNFIYANKLPVALIHPGHAEIIPNCRTN